MTIRTGINPGAILWKYTETQKRHVYDYDKRKYEFKDIVDYYVIRLETRRARTRGAAIRKDVYPFFESLRIKMTPTRIWGNGDYVQGYTAVGTSSERVRDEEAWNALEIDEQALRWYNTVRNINMVPLLDRMESKFSEGILKEMQAHAKDDESEVLVWPPEPNIRIYSMELSSSYYHRGINWR